MFSLISSLQIPICIAAIIITKQPQKNLRLLEKQQFVFVNIIFINYNKTAAEKSTAVRRTTIYVSTLI